MTATKAGQQELIDQGQRLVYSLASRISRKIPVRFDLDDLIAYGQIGLAEAARDFDPERGTQFSTFAYYRIRGAIYDGLSKMSWTSRARYNRLRYEQMAGEALSQDSEASPEAESLEDEARWFRNLTDRLAVVYLASHYDEGRSGDTLEDSIQSPSVQAAIREVSEKLRTLVNELPVAQRRLVQNIYFQGANLQQAADRLGISKSWASRLHAKTLEQLARSLRRIGAAD